MKYAYRTEIGIRESNQDSLFVPSKEFGESCAYTPLVVVADGMGGHRAGNIASLLAVNSIQSYVELHNEDNKRELLQHAINYANKAVFLASKEDVDCFGMGTTAVMAYVEEKYFSFANVGDSRLYLLSSGGLSQLSRDHSFVEELFEQGVITREQADLHPQRHILTRAIGVAQYVKADTALRPWKTGDLIMLCSDGLHGSVSLDEMSSILTSSNDLAHACDKLVETALANGSRDNITVVLAENDGGIAK